MLRFASLPPPGNQDLANETIMPNPFRCLFSGPRTSYVGPIIKMRRLAAWLVPLSWQNAPAALILHHTQV
jgi:hypothetical protein